MQHPITQAFEVLDHQAPTVTVVPVLGLAGRLRGDAYVGFDNAALGVERQSRRSLRGVNAQNVARRTVQTDHAEVDRLLSGIATKEQADAVSRIGFSHHHRLRGGKLDIGVLISKQVGDFPAQGAFELALMVLGKALGIRKPADEIAQGANGKGDQDRFVFKIQRVIEYRDLLTTLPNLDRETHKVLLGALYPAALYVAGE